MDLATNDVRELRRDVNTLTLTVSQLKNDLAHEKATTKLILDSHEKDGKHLKESIDSRFDVLLTRLDSKLAAFENRMPPNQSEKKFPRSLENGLED
jgi:hypothetical protein